MKKGRKTLFILLCVVSSVIAAFVVRNAQLPKFERSEGKFTINGLEYHRDGRFSLSEHGAVIGKLADTGEKVCKVDDEGYFLYLRNKPFTLKYNPLVREDAVEAYLSGVSRLVMNLGPGKAAETGDKQVIKDFVQAILSEEGHIRLASDDVKYYVGAVSDAFPTVQMGFEVIEREGKYYAETEFLREEGSEYAHMMLAPLGESASAWLESELNG